MSSENNGAVDDSTRQGPPSLDQGSSAGEGYLRFSSRLVRARPRKPSAPLPAEVAKTVYGIDGRGADSWQGFARWCVSSTRSQVVIVADSQGLIVAQEGDVSVSEAASVAWWLAEVALSRSLPSAPGGELISISGEFEEGWLTGIAITPPEATSKDQLVVGVITEKPMFFDARRAVVEQGLATLRRLKES